jgi:hypothetical protein
MLNAVVLVACCLVLDANYEKSRGVAECVQSAIEAVKAVDADYNCVYTVRGCQRTAVAVELLSWIAVNEWPRAAAILIRKWEIGEFREWTMGDA